MPGIDDVEAELSNLYDAKINDWLMALSECNALLALLPASLARPTDSPLEKARTLYRVFKEVIDGAYEAIQDASTETPAHDVLAASAAIGLIATPRRTKFEHPFTDDQGALRRPKLKTTRQDYAATWFADPRGAKTFSRRKERCFAALAAAVLRFLDDEEAVADLAMRLGRQQHRQRPKEDRAPIERVPLPEIDEAALAASHPEYIARPEIVAHFVRGRDEGHRVFLLYGEPGTGKSDAAMDLAYRVLWPNTNPLHIHANDERARKREISRFLGSRDEETLKMNDAAMLNAFVDALCEDDAPPVVILDGLEDSKTLNELVPKHPRSIVIATSRTRLGAYSAKCDILVDNLDEVQAVAMIKNRTPSISDDEARLLAEELKGRPLAIEHSCAYLRSPDARGVADFCTAIRTAPASALANVGGLEEPTLTAIYSTVLSSLQKEPNAMKLLDLVLLAGPLKVDTESARLAWVDFQGQDISEESAMQVLNESAVDRHIGEIRTSPEYLLPASSSISAELAARRAIDVLRHWSLIEVTDGNLIDIHLLTHELLRELRRDGLPAVAEQVLSISMALLRRSSWQPTEDLPFSAVLWLPVLIAAIGTTMNEKERKNELTASVLNELRLGLLTASAIRADRQLGQPSKFLRAAALKTYLILSDAIDSDPGVEVYTDDVAALATELYSRMQVAGPTWNFHSDPAVIAGLCVKHTIEPMVRFLEVGDHWTPPTMNGYFSEIDKYTDQMYEHAVEQGDRRNIAKALYLLGTFRFDQGYPEAYKCFAESYRLNREVWGSATSLRDMTEAMCRMFEMWLRGFGKPEDIDLLLDELDGIRKGRFGDPRTLDYTTLAKVNRAVIELDRRRLMVDMVKEGRSERILRRAGALLEMYRNFIVDCNRAGLDRLLPGAYYGMGCLAMATDPLEGVWSFIDSYRDYSQNWRWDFAALRFQLAMFKGYAYLYHTGFIETLPHNAPRKAIRVGAKALFRYSSVELASESYAVAWLLAHLLKYPDSKVERMRELARNVAESSEWYAIFDLFDSVFRGERDILSIFFF